MHRSLERQAGTGDLSFRLKWQGDADLDLHVRQPDGLHVGFLPPTPENLKEFAERMSGNRSEGKLDIDCNSSAMKMCPFPIENIYWPKGSAPSGRYEVWVQLYQPGTGSDPVAYELEIREGRTVRRRMSGSLEEPLETSETASYEF